MPTTLLLCTRNSKILTQALTDVMLSVILIYPGLKLCKKKNLKKPYRSERKCNFRKILTLIVGLLTGLRTQETL